MMKLPEIRFDITYRRKEKKLPNVLSKYEIESNIKIIRNFKHKVLIMLIYSSGLRVGEAVNLKISNIDSKRGIINIQKGKGAKDRMSLLSKKALDCMREYYRLFKPR